MDTPANPLPPRLRLPRWLRVGLFLALIVFVQGTFAYLLTWVDPPRAPVFVSIRVHAYAHWTAPKMRRAADEAGKNAVMRAEIQDALDTLASCSESEPVIVYLSAIAVQAEAARVYVIPGDARPDDPTGWLPLHEILSKLKACPSKQKLLVFEWQRPAALDRAGFVYHDIAAALPGELDAVPDAGRLVLSACSAGQQTHFSAELGQSVFAHYFEQGRLGHADGYGAARDSRVSVKELANFMQARVARWTTHNRGDQQTPMLLGSGDDFTLASVDPAALRDKTPALVEIKEAFHADLAPSNAGASHVKPFPDATKKFIDEQRGILDQRLAAAKPADAERIKSQFMEDLRAKLPPSGLDVAVFSHILADGRLDPGAFRLFDKLLHPAPATVPDSAEGLYIRQLSDLAARIEIQAWPRDLIGTFLRASDLEEKAIRQDPHVPGYVALLNEPALTRHLGAVRLWTSGYANPDDAKRLLTSAHDQLDRLLKLNDRWWKSELALDQARAELPAYLEALEAMAELREPWQAAATATRSLADVLKTRHDDLPWQTRMDKLTAQLSAAEEHVQTLQQHQKALHEPFARAAVAKLERQCRAPHADAGDRQTAEALLSVSAPVLHADDRLALGRAVNKLSRRLVEDILTLDQKDDEGQRLTPLIQVEKEGRKRLLDGWQQEPADQRKHLAWMMPPLKVSRDVSSRHEKDRRDRWQHEHYCYLARDYGGLNLDSPGIVAARTFYAAKGESKADAHVRLNAATVGPITDRQPYADMTLEMTRHVPSGKSGPVELRFHRADDVWLEIAPDAVTLPALADAKEPYTLTHKVPIKVMRLPKAERTGLPPPLGFLVEARFEGRSYHHLVTAPIVPSTQELQILVSADADEPANTLNEIRVRPGKMKQPHFVYVKNLTNRKQTVHVEVKAGATLVHKSQKLLTLEPDGVRKVVFDEPSAVRELHGPLAVRVFDVDRLKVLAERSLRVEILSPHEYVKVAEASFEPGRDGNNKWAVQVSAVDGSPPVVGPAIAAQLVLPVQRIPGLLAVGGGTLKVELPTRSDAPRLLFAERLKLAASIDEEGPVYLHIDGVPRAFVFSTTFARTGAASQPKPDVRPAVRLVAPPCVMAGVNCLIDVEVDNAPRGAKLEVALGRIFEDNTFQSELVRDFTDAKKHRIDMEVSRDALIFDAAIADWTATFDTRSIVGPRALRARLLDTAGKEIAEARQALVIDDSPPLARLAPTPAQVKKGTVMQVQAQGVDPESGVAQVVFFYGKPDKGEIPPGAARFKAVPANRELTQWSAALQVPADHKGPLAVSVQVVNHAGMATIDTVTLDVTDNDPGKTGLGEIRGRVTEGPRAQPNLLVTLFDERGKEIARTKTLADGTYVFAQLAPGRYRVVCVKPESQRRAVLDTTVEPDRMARVDLTLAL